MLGTGVLAGTAIQAAFGVGRVNGLPREKQLAVVPCGEKLRNTDLLRTDIHTITAGCTGDLL